MVRIVPRPPRYILRRRPWWPGDLVHARFSHTLESRLAGGLPGLKMPAALVPAPGGRAQSALRRLPLPLRMLRMGLYLFLGFHLLWISFTTLLVISFARVDPPATVLMAYRAWADGWKLEPPRPLSLRSIPPWLTTMLIAVEDHSFREHHGFDIEAIKRAMEINRSLSEPLYGGSTLSMQTARTLFLVPEKSYFRKYLEAIVTIELEAILGKDRILELYFGYAEWGRGIFGIEAAARHWYGKGAASLTRDEGARLLSILSSPIKYRPTWFGKSRILVERYAFLSRRYGRAGATAQGAPAELPVPGAPADLPEPAAPSARSAATMALPVVEAPSAPLPSSVPGESLPTETSDSTLE
ncbi:MAG: biosynthetic peptidoglycan transglycosylase [Spirochaetota bacterium]